MLPKPDPNPPSDFPPGLAAPARRALAGAGLQSLDHLTQVTEAEVARLHGMGPNAMDKLRRALAASGRAFRGG
jgi:hypothetical protein